MAVPTVVAVGGVAASTAATTPPMPAGVLTDDICLLFVETADQAASVNNALNTGISFAELENVPVSGATRLTVFWGRATQDSPTVGTGYLLDSGDHQIGRMIVFRGCAISGDPWDVISTDTEVSDTSAAIPGATTTVADCLVVAAIAVDLPDANGTANFSAWANADLTSVTERIDQTRSEGNGGGIGVATGQKALVGTYGSTTATLAAAAQKAMMSIALKPPPPPSGTLGTTSNTDTTKYAGGLGAESSTSTYNATTLGAASNTDDYP